MIFGYKFTVIAGFGVCFIYWVVNVFSTIIVSAEDSLYGPHGVCSNP
jgi:hypothetical protein